MRVIAILGDKLSKNNKISLSLKKRLDRGISLYKSDNNPTFIIVCGGNVCGNVCGNVSKNYCNHTEAYIMKKYIIEKTDISKNKIISENRSMNTIMNITNLKKIIKLNKIKVSSITIISSPWHLPRVKYICNKLLPGRVKFINSSEKLNEKKKILERKYLAEVKKILG